MADDFSAVTKQLIEDRQARQKELEAQKELLSKMATELESAGMKAEDNAEYNKKSNELQKAELKFRLKGADSPSARKEIKQEQAALAKKNQNLLGKIANGVTGMFGKMGEKVKGAGKGIMAMLKGTLVAGLLLAVVAFLESPYWTKTKAFIVDTIVPAIEKFWGYLKMLSPIFEKYFVDTWNNIKELFSGLGESFDLFSKGEWWEGIKTFFSSIGTFIGKQIDTVITAVYNIIAKIFGLSPTDSVFGSIWGFFTDLYDDVVSWIKITWFNIITKIENVFTGIKDFFVDTFNFISEGIAKGWTTATDYITGVWNSIHSWFTGLWTWASGGIAKGWTTVTAYITGIWNTVVGWFKGLWAWGKKAGATEEGGFSLTKIVDAAFLKVKDWVLSIFRWGTSPVGPNDSWIAKTIKAVIKKVKDWALSLFAWADTPGDSWISTTVKNVIKNVKAWVIGLFTWASEAGKVDGKEWSLSTMIKAVVDKVIGWVTGIFTWGKEKGKKDGKGKFSILTLIDNVVSDIIQAIKDIIPSFSDLKSMLPSASELLGKLKFWGNGEKNASGGPLKQAPTLVGEMGPEIILPSSSGHVMNANRTAQMQAAGLRRGAGSSGGAPAVVNAPVNTINNSQNNTSIDSTPMFHPNPLLGAVNLAT